MARCCAHGPYVQGEGLGNHQAVLHLFGCGLGGSRQRARFSGTSAELHDRTRAAHLSNANLLQPTD